MRRMTTLRWHWMLWRNALKESAQRSTTSVIHTTRAAYYSPYTLLRLLEKFSLGEDSFPSLVIGNIITSGLTKHPTPLQISLGVYFHKKSYQPYARLLGRSGELFLWRTKEIQEFPDKGKLYNKGNTSTQPTKVDGLVHYRCKLWCKPE